MNKLYTNWREVKLVDIGNIITGSTPPTKDKEYFGKDCLFITPTDYRNCNKYISNSERGISILGIEKLKNRLLPSGSIMVTCIATMGKVLINKLPAITNQQINSIIIDNKKFSADFICYLLIHNNNKIKSIVSGSAVPILNKKDFSNLVFEFSPLVEQKRIASILSAHLAIMRAGIFFQIGLSIFAYSSNKATADIPLFAPFLYTITLEALGFFFSSHTSFQTLSSPHQKVSTPSNSPVLCAIIR